MIDETFTASIVQRATEYNRRLSIDAKDYLPTKLNKLPNGTTQHVVTYKSTTTLAKTEFSEYLQKIERDTGVPMPGTGEFHYRTKDEQEYDIRQTEQYNDEYQEPTLLNEH